MCPKGPEGVVSLQGLFISFSPAPLCYPLVMSEEGAIFYRPVPLYLVFLALHRGAGVA
jgi:hypothetical protein